MPKPTRHAPLDAESHARLFLQLAHTEKAGFPAAEAFGMIAKNDTTLRKRLDTMPARLKSGQKIADAGFKAGLFDDNHRALIAAAENSGKLAELYKKLADYYNGVAKRQKKMRSRLYLPAFILAMAFFVQPLPQLVAAKISLGRYLYESAGQLLIMAIGITLLIKLPRILASMNLMAEWHHLQLRVPPIAKWVTNRQLNTFFFMLAVLLDAGQPFTTALPQAIASIKNTPLRKQFAPALAMMETGSSVAETLASVALMKANTLQIIKSGEHSGQLAGTLLHFTEIDAENLALQDEAFAEWLPRLVYTAIGLWMAASILAQGLPHLA